ncbi:hypothetical protein BDZ85DRAFT_243805 [Elsinoe ampelina]|uniref:LEA domain protein n=1 Tax=Elsinoe ampelina TaxID=302913 RepID=A0A6A6G0P3_9PEZI|nr:hypothetical protein BDZ85DRAFT_243805 [Elsinoe ampelina]
MSAFARTVRVLPTAARVRPFSTTYAVKKSATEAAKDTLKSVDRTISDNLVKGIDKTSEAAQAAKSAVNSNTGSAQGKASELAGEAQGKASELSGKAKSALNSNSGTASGKAEELKGEAKGKASELSGKAKGAAEEIKGKMS